MVKKQLQNPFSMSRRSFTMGAGAALASAAMPLRHVHAAKPIKLGVLAPMSGFLAREGQACKRGFDLAGPIMADMGMPVDMMFADTESNPDKARTAAEKLIGEGANMLVGTFASGETMAVAQVAEQRGIPHVINIAAAPQITKQGYKYVFRNFPTGPMLIMQGFGLMKDLFKTTGVTPKSAVFMHVNDTFGQAMNKGVTALFPKMKMPFEILETIAYDGKAKDLSVEVAKAKATGADILMPVCHGPDAIKIMRECVKQRWEPMGIMTPGSPGTYDQAFYKTLGKFSEYVIANVPWMDPTMDMTKALTAAFKKKFPDNLMELNVGFSFEAVLIAATAHKMAGSTNPQELAEALRKTNIVSHVMTGGPIQFDKEGQNVNIGSAAVQNINRTPTVVLPAASALNKPVFPMPGWKDAMRK